MTTATQMMVSSDASHTVEALCPLCRIRVEVPVTLQTLVKVTSAKTVIHITLLQDTTLHTCGQLRIDDVQIVDGVVFDDGSVRRCVGAAFTCSDGHAP